LRVGNRVLHNGGGCDTGAECEDGGDTSWGEALSAQDTYITEVF